MNRWEGAFRPLLSAAATCSRGSLAWAAFGAAADQ